MVGADLAYLVQTEIIRSQVGSQSEVSTQRLRATMVISSRGRRLADYPSPCRFADEHTAAEMIVTTSGLTIGLRRILDRPILLAGLRVSRIRRGRAPIILGRAGFPIIQRACWGVA
jgi:hypothetical protein